MATLLLVMASVAYAAGGLFMKQSGGATQLAPTVGFLLLFAVGATLQAIGMRQEAMGSAYVFVLGVEAVVAVLLSAWLLQEPYSPSKLVAMAIVVAGIAWLRLT
jgi:multidrug transporter EmrE-like cation transporter